MSVDVVSWPAKRKVLSWETVFLMRAGVGARESVARVMMERVDSWLGEVGFSDVLVVPFAVEEYFSSYWLLAVRDASTSRYSRQLRMSSLSHDLKGRTGSRKYKMLKPWPTLNACWESFLDVVRIPHQAFSPFPGGQVCAPKSRSIDTMVMISVVRS